MKIETEVPDVISMDWVISLFVGIPCRYWETLNKVLVTEISEDQVDFPEHQYYAGDYYREVEREHEDRTIMLFVPLWNEKHKCFMGINKVAWDQDQVGQCLRETFNHELGHHISLHIIGYKQMARYASKIGNESYERFYDGEELRARKFEKLLNNGEWKTIDGIVKHGIVL